MVNQREELEQLMIPKQKCSQGWENYQEPSHPVSCSTDRQLPFCEAISGLTLCCTDCNRLLQRIDGGDKDKSGSKHDFQVASVP